MDLKYWAATDVGRKRTHNEDNFLIDQELRFFVVADGMGGHASGEVASAMAVHTIRGILAREHDLFEQGRDDDPTWHMEICMLLEYAVHVACEQIYSKGVQEPEKKGMGTTVVSLLIVGDRGYIAYVGDSRIYLLRGGIVYQLTEDHSLMNELIRQGKITAEAFDDSPYAQFKHAMTRAVGPNEAVEVDTLDFDMIPGDSFLLCSDGLYEYLDDSDISHMLALTEVKDIPGRLIDMANTRGGKDNITALIIQVPENADGSDRAAEINFTLDTLKSIPLFAALTYQQLVRIMNLTRIVPFEAGNVLCHEGQPAEELFVILRGLVELESGGSHVATLPQGSHFGEMALVGTTPRSATATAVADGKLLIINREDFYEILRKEAPLAVKLLWAFVQELSSRLRQANLDLSQARDPSSEASGMLGHGAPADEVMDIMDLSEEIVVSESSAELSRDELTAELANESADETTEDTVREPSDTLSLDPNEMRDLDEDDDLDGLDTIEPEAVELDADEVLAVQVQAPSEPTIAAAPTIAARTIAAPTIAAPTITDLMHRDP
ncbi:cyclic nucleotide-binding domain-containing protein, partial [Enhygromyxa salina]|uniref:cyclic nucleotide-binding domain-containing protein n=1 Tax=Enhygromyxa salina TaxID=215803 RepID=UPI00069886DC